MANRVKKATSAEKALRKDFKAATKIIVKACKQDPQLIEEVAMALVRSLDQGIYNALARHTYKKMKGKES